MKETYAINTHVNVQAVNEARFDIVVFEVGRACERVLAAARRDPSYYSGDIAIHVSIGPPPPAAGDCPELRNERLCPR